MTEPSSLSVNRRRFLQSSLLGAAGVSLLPGTLPAAEPIQRTGKPKMKLSLAAYSFNRALPKSWTKESLQPGQMTLDDFIDYCAELQLDGCELTGYYFPKDVTADYLNHLKEKTFRLGLEISGTAIGNDFCVAEPDKREAQLKSARQWIDNAAGMGAPVIRIFAGTVPQGDNEEEAIARCIEGINESLEYAAQKGVFLALENHGGITATPAQMIKIIEGIKPSPWFGVNFDSGNFRTEDPYRDLEQIAPYAINAQIKVAMNVGGKKQEADLERIISILKTANYRGYIVLEYEEQADPKTEIPKYIEELRKLIG